MLLALLLSGRRPSKEPRFRFVAAAALFLFLFPILWNISFSIRRDWDLFSSLGPPVALLGALAWFGSRRRRETEWLACRSHRVTFCSRSPIGFASR